MVELTEQERQDLAALADAALPRRRRRQLEAKVASSSRIGEALERQQLAVEALQAVDIEASPALRARVDEARKKRARPRRPFALALGFAAATAAAAAVLAIVLPIGADGPNVPDVARLAELPATGSAPTPSPDAPALLDVEAQGLAYPNWDDGELDWVASGARADDVGDRSADTVFYRKDGKEIAYTIVSGDALEPPPKARRTIRDGVEFSSFRQDGRVVVTWLRGGHTCVLSGADVERRTMLDLAAWRGGGAVAF